MKKLIFPFLIFLSLSINAQLLDSETLYDKIVLLKQTKGANETHGTGFLMTSNGVFFLITAKHVADSLQTDFAEIYFRSSSKKAIGYKLKQFLSANSVRKFNSESDFFVLQLEPFDSASRKVLEKASLEGKQLASDRVSLDRQIDVVVFGYPIYDFEHFTPITFKSYFSSSLIDINVKGMTKPCYCYLLENPSMEGFSGGPVFVGVKDRATAQMGATLIIGIVSATAYDKTGGKFAVITPTFHLLDLIKK